LREASTEKTVSNVNNKKRTRYVSMFVSYNQVFMMDLRIG
jgi:hypothetical protein